MQILEITQKVTDGKLIIQIPEGFEGKDVNVVITEKMSDVDPDDWTSLPGNERVKILKQFEGSAKYPDTPIDKYEWYEQAGDY